MITILYNLSYHIYDVFTFTTNIVVSLINTIYRLTLHLTVILLNIHAIYLSITHYTNFSTTVIDKGFINNYQNICMYSSKPCMKWVLSFFVYIFVKRSLVVFIGQLKRKHAQETQDVCCCCCCCYWQQPNNTYCQQPPFNFSLSLSLSLEVCL